MVNQNYWNNVRKQNESYSFTNKTGADIKLENVAHIKGVKTIKGMDLVGSDLRSSAALIIAGIIAKGSSKIMA